MTKPIKKYSILEEMSRILHLDDNHPYLIEALSDIGFQNVVDTSSDKQVLQGVMRSYVGIVIRSRFTIDKAFMDTASQLKFIARVGSGLENIDVDYAKQRGIHLIAAPEGNAPAVGEHALGMLLNLLNRITIADREVRSGQWLREANRGEELFGKIIGIIGYGNTGRSFAKLLRGFDAKVLCYDIKENVGDEYAQQVDISELQEKTDILSLHVPQTSQTLEMVRTSFIQSFAKPFWLINTARGKCVSVVDLVDALDNGKVKGAALDVLAYESTSFESLMETKPPEVWQRLIHSDKVVLTPHIAGWSHQSSYRLASVIVDKIKQWKLSQRP